MLAAAILLTQAALATPAAPTQSSGALDTTFDPGAGANDIVFAVATQPDGKVLIGGAFTSVNGSTHNRLARLDTNGGVDSAFIPDVNGSVLAIVVQPDNKILIGGTFTMTNSTARNRIARLNADGTLDTTFDPGDGASNEVDAIALQSNGKIVIGGKFTTVDGTGRVRIARLNANGSLDTGFDPGTGAATGTPTVYAVMLQPDGKVLIGGGFQTVDGVSRSGIARLWGDRFVFLPLVLR